MKKKTNRTMERAAIAMLEIGSYPCGMPDDRFVFAGRFEAACESLVDGGLAERHPAGLRMYSKVSGTLTSEGRAVAKQQYRLTRSGKAYAENLVENAKKAQTKDATA